MNLFKVLVALHLFVSSAACHVKNNETLVSDILDNRERYIGQEVTVVGVLSITSKEAIICDVNEKKICMNLAIPSGQFDYAMESNFKLVQLSGTYTDHEFKNIEGKDLFFPSRLVVHDIDVR